MRTGFTLDGTIAFQDIKADYLIGAYADIADRVVGKGSYTGAGPYRVPAVADPRPERPLAHAAVHRVPRLRQPAGELGGRVEPGRGGPRARAWTALEIRLRNLARKGDAFIPFDTPADGDWEQTVRRAAELIGWGSPVPDGRGRGIALGIKSGPTTGLSYSTVRLLARRQRRHLRRHLGHGPGRPDGLRADRGRGARRADRLGHGRDGRHGGRVLRPADLGQPVDGADGQLRAAGLPGDPGQGAGDGRPAPRVDEAQHRRGRGVVRLPDASSRSSRS